MTVIDVHVHVYPDKIAERASASVGEFYNIPMAKPGSVQAYLDAIEGTPITHSVIHSVAVKPSNVQSINDFIAATCQANPQFTGFATLHQDFENPEAEIERIIGMGLKGIKLHPDTQGVNLDDPRLMRIYEIIEGRLPIILHCGDYRYDFSHPRRLKSVLRTFPKLVVDAAHFGGWSVFDYALEYLENENCFLDMSSSMDFLGPRRTKELCEAYGSERILFGSDFPMWNPASELERFTALDFTQEQLDNMLFRNAQRFLGWEE